MRFPDEVLMAYADDELDDQTRAAVEAAMASDAEIARRIARHKALRSRVHAAFDKVAGEAVPARLLEAVRTAPSIARNDNIVPLRRRPAGRWAWTQWTAIAASLIVGAIAGRLLSFSSRAPEVIAMRGGHILASGLLANALSDQLTAVQPNASPVHIGISFRSKSGEYCRTFSMRQPAALAGLACRTADGWHLGVLTPAELPAGGPGAYRQAASSLPPAIVAAVSNQIAGEPLDAHAEAVARGHHWQP